MIRAAILILLVTVAPWAISAPAYAQDAIASNAAADELTRGLEAQYQAAIIHERRLADDREQRVIAQAEARLREARRQADARLAGSEVELRSARAAFANLVARIASRDSEVRAEIAAYRAEIAGLAQRASPDLLAAYHRFADGDRVGAWPIIHQLTQAQVRATIAGANARAAAQVRDAAEVRDTMRLNGEASVADVLALWTQASQLDPTDFWTHMNRSRLLRQMGSLAESWDAAVRAGAVASTDYLRLTAVVEIGDVAWTGGHWQRARQIYHDAIGFASTLSAQDETDDAKLHLMQIIIERWASSGVTDDQASVILLHTFVGLARERHIRPERLDELAATIPTLQLPPPEWVSNAEQLIRLNLRTDEARAAALPANAEAQRQLSVSLSQLGYLFGTMLRWSDAEPLFRRAYAIDQAVHQRTPTQSAAMDLATDARWLGDTLAAQGNLREALPLYQEVLALSRHVASSDPSNVDNQHEVAIALVRLGAMHFLQRQFTNARISWGEASEIMDRLHSTAPANETWATDRILIQSLTNLVLDQ